MKKLLYLITAIIMVSSVLGYTIDGDLSDWGVNLGSGISGTVSGWVPTTNTVDWKVEDNIDPDCLADQVFSINQWPGRNCMDWTGFSALGTHVQGNGSDYTTYDEPLNGNYEHPAGGEHYDVEALYFDDDPQYGYFAIVTSMGPAGYAGNSVGDLAIDMDNDINTGEFGYEYGIKLTGPNQGKICFNPDWAKPDAFPTSAPFTFTCASFIGVAELAYVNANAPDNGVDNWVIEIKVPRSLIGNPTPQQISDLHTTFSCGNDEIELNDYVWNYGMVPEFTAIGAALALFGAGFYTLRKRR